MAADITVVIPTIPPRAHLLDRALKSVQAQTLPALVAVAVDNDHAGAAATRNAALAQVETPWVAFLDDDDEFLPQHLELLMDCAAAACADMVYPWFTVVGGGDPLGRFGMPFDPDELRQRNYIPVTVLVRTELVREAGGFVNVHEPPHPTCEDWGLWMRLLDLEARIVHLPERTWIWHHHGKNTGGRSDCW